MRPVSLDIRERVIAALQSGQTRPEVAERFSISVGTVGRLAKQWREENHLTPRPITGRPRAIGETEQELLRSLVASQKDATLESLSQALAEQTGKKISLSALQRNLIWLGYWATRTKKGADCQRAEPREARRLPESGSEG